jgi:8-oxo-dGTP diphosphatase
MVEVVCGVIENDQGELLACRRPAGKSLAGLWEFPGGKIEPGELPSQALARELREELGIEVEVLQALTPVIWNYGGFTIRLAPFRCRIIGGDLRPLEHAEITWCSALTWGGLLWAAADLPILGEIFPGSR